MRIKKLDKELPDPSIAYEYDAGIDLYSAESRIFYENNKYTVGSGIAVEIPRGNVGLVIIRSSVGRLGLALQNSVGVIDSGYRGEIMLPLMYRGRGDETYLLYRGDKIAQLVVVKLTFGGQHIEIVDELSPSDREEAGFGSSGNT